MNRKSFIQKASLGLGGLFLYQPMSLFGKTKHQKETIKKPIIIIGSGYGGAVAALRLCEAGNKVCLLEMGLNWEKSGEKFSPMIHPGKSAAWLRKKSIAPFFNVFPLKPFTGALDRLDYKDIKIWVGRGVGGGSIVNGGMAVLPKKNYFEEIFPTLDADLFYEKYFPLAQQELNVNVANEDFLHSCSYYKFNTVGEEEAHKAGYKTMRVPNVYDFKYMEAEYENKVPRSALAGEVIYGNNHGKNSLDKTYLKKALATGNLEILDLHQVKSFSLNPDDSYTLQVHQINTSGELVQLKEMHCQKLILAAGTMGSLELLFRSQAKHQLPLDAHIGKMWGNNGNFMTGRNWVKAFSGGNGFLHSTIPVGGIDNWDDPKHPFFTEIAPLPMGMNVATSLYLMINKLDKFGEVTYHPTEDKIELKWDLSHTQKMKENARHFIKKMNRTNGGTRAHFLFHNGFGHDICYHPLGGAVIDKATNAYGKLNLHQNLFVLDGSLIPGSIGVNPFLTITALTEYCMEHLLASKAFETV
ncbi:GMC family oxidoreductase N-terminal domain-containing protein [Vaginella massiliensis]|uniref:GMC family oxidoreductase N-terminal domain-containing protein n=1 Tax=Vaginella massiliensis TaxID=1816680 RepID=UPI00083958A3|nr:GMC family oxidoreductase N-terminal domain-containing protein [Vaginella massiliensis]